VTPTAMVQVVPIEKTAEQFDFALEVKRLALGPYVIEQWGWDEDSNATDGCVEIEDFYILPSYQRRGIGTEVLTGILSEAKACKATVRLRCLKWNPARGLYARNGFVATSEDETHLYMEKPP